VATRFLWDDFVLDLDSYRLERAGVQLSLEPKAFNLLVLMVRRPGHLFSKQEIFQALWADTAVTDHALTRVVAQLRRVLGDEAREARYIETVPTRGYRWIRPVEAAASALSEPDPTPPDAAIPERSGRIDHAYTGARRILPGVSAALALGLIALAFLGWAQRFDPATATAIGDAGAALRDPKWPVQITTHSGLDMHPAISPQGDAIAFASDRSGALEIYVRALGGGSVETALTRDGSQSVQPAWSPDGTMIAFHSLRTGGIWVVSARGGTPKQISAVGARPAWSPDGRRIAFQLDEHGDVAPNGYSAQAGSTIWIADADGGNAQALTSAMRPVGGHASPSWSHDGRFIAFSVFDGLPDNGIWVVSMETRAVTPLDRGRNLYDPIFTKDDRDVIAAGAEPFVVRLPFDARTGQLRAPREIIPVPGVAGVRGLSLSPGSTRLIFAGLSLESQIWMLPVAPDGRSRGKPVAITKDTSRRNSLPVSSPDGTQIAYMSIRQGELPNVWVMDANGANPLQITADETADHKPAWFADSRRVAYMSKRGKSGGLWAVDIHTRREEMIFDFDGAEQYPTLEGRLAEFQLSPSMTLIAFSLLTPPQGRRALFVATATPFAPRPIGSPTISAGYPAWSPDERRLAIEIKNDGSTQAGVVDLQDGTIRQLTHARGQTWVRSWSPDGRRMAVAAQRDGVWSLRSIDAETGDDLLFAPPEPPRVYVRYPDWSMQGDRLLFERGEIRGNIWTLAWK
jgi:Tol biopolymer transport system component/DNA-binding winged helix-turn-helix (wHTH) protein